MSKHPVGQFIKENALSLTLFALFFLFLVGLSITGYYHENETRAEHHQIALNYGEYVTSGEFIEAVFENWESEFLQMAALVLLTIFLYQKGSADSKKLRGKEDVDTSSRYSIIRAQTWRQKGRVTKQFLYENSLSFALLFLFLLSFTFHAFGGVDAYNQEAQLHGGEQLSVLQYVASVHFWFESFQNWQSEFLAVGTLLVLSVFLRQRGSPESKPIGESNAKTGH